LFKEIKLPMDLDIHRDEINTKVPDKRLRIVPFKARILELGFIRAESAVIGLLKG